MEWKYTLKICLADYEYDASFIKSMTVSESLNVNALCVFITMALNKYG